MVSNPTKSLYWWRGEDVVRLTCVPRHVPARADGSMVSQRTVHHWALHGIAGIRLRRFRCGGQWCTTKDELARWQAAITAAADSAPRGAIA